MATNAKRSSEHTAISNTKQLIDSIISHRIAEADALFLSIGEGAIVTDSEGNISRINKVALEILGFTRSEVLGKWYPEVVIAEDENGEVIERMDRPITEAFITGKPVFRKLYFRRKDGSRVAVAVTVSPILLDQRPLGAIEIFRDITDEVRLERAKNEFIFLASHQLRTPATGVKQYLHLVLDGYGGDVNESQRKFLETANASNDRQLKIIDDLLRVASMDAGNVTIRKRKINLVPLIQSVIDEQSSSFSKNEQQVVFAPSKPNISANVDKDAFRMVLENLINNAHKYSYPGKSTFVEITSNNQSVKITVRDEGVGIKSADLDKLFKKFSRIDNPLSISSGGTGIGLYWVKQIVDLHGGTIKATSKQGQGTSFIIELEK